MNFLLFREEDDYRSYQSEDEEELEAPLPLKDDYDWQQQNSFLFPPHYRHSCGKSHICLFLHKTDVLFVFLCF